VLIEKSLAATVGYAAIRHFGEEQMKDCIRVARQAQLQVPLLGYSVGATVLRTKINFW